MGNFFFSGPLLVAVGVSHNVSDWDDNAMYGELAEQVGGAWLQSWVVGAISLGCVGMFEADMSCGSFQLLGMAERGMIPAFFATRSRHGTPTWGILFAFCIIWTCIFFSLEDLVEMLNVVYIWAAILEIAAFLSLRWSNPNARRPFKIPLSNTAVTLLMVPCVVFSFVVMYYAKIQAHIYALAGCIGSLLLGIAMTKLKRRRPGLFLRHRVPARAHRVPTCVVAGNYQVLPTRSDDDFDEGENEDVDTVLARRSGSENSYSDGNRCVL